MVIAAFYVMTADVSAEDAHPSNEIIDEAATSIEHFDRRITISNVMASAPAVAVGTDGVTHFAWVDGAPGSQRVSWKRSNDSLRTFTPDMTITTPFHSISNLSLVLNSAFGVAVVFEGRIASEASPIVHFLYSAGNDDWSPVHAVSAGHTPSMTTDGDSLYIALNVISEGRERYSVAAMKLIDGAINTILLTALPVSASDGDIAFFDGMLNIAMVEKISNVLYFMQFTDNGTVMTEPALVSRTLVGRSVDLISMNGNGQIMFVDNNSLMMARCLGQPNNWVSHTVLELNEMILGASLSASHNSIRISYTTESSNGSNVHVVECSPIGDSGEDALISTPGLDAASPFMFSVEGGSFSCLYVEEHDGTKELFLRHDIDYVVADIASSPLNGASFYSTDPLKATASGHIIAVISKNVTASQAETILTMLTHNTTGGRIGNNVTISTTSLYLLHLPNDILSAIPTSVMNSGMGEGPNYYSLGSVIGDIAGMVFDFLVWVATGGVLLLLAHLVKEGLKAIGNLVSTAISAVEAAVDRIVDAFVAFVDWAISMAREMLEQFYDSFIAPIFAVAGASYMSISAMADRVNETGDSESMSAFIDALYGNLFLSMVVLSMGINAVLLAMKVITGGMSFLLGTIVSLVVMVLVMEIFGIIPTGGDPGHPGDASRDPVISWITSFFGQQGGADMIAGILNNFWFTIMIIPSLMILDATGSTVSLAVTLFCLLMSFYSLAASDVLINVLLCAICGILTLGSIKPIANLNYDLQMIVYGFNIIMAGLLIVNIGGMIL